MRCAIPEMFFAACIIILGVVIVSSTVIGLFLDNVVPLVIFNIPPLISLSRSEFATMAFKSSNAQESGADALAPPFVVSLPQLTRMPFQNLIPTSSSPRPKTAR